MSTVTMDGLWPFGTAKRKAAGGKPTGSLFDRFVEMQEKRAEHFTARYLSGYSTAELRNFGLSDAEIVRLTGRGL
ncbi:MAG: hypothetical protein AAFZ01_10955 [Pseudomonadota bacterium]